ncbi:MAG: SpoVG family protein [Clostridiales bacterium]|nr:SpoVG family protein [Clostridiales bacterium]
MNENNNQNEKNTPVETPRVTARITWLNSEPDPTVDPRRATASITIADCFRVRGLAVFNGKNGLFVSMPVRPMESKGTKTYVDVAHPVTREMWQAIQDSVLDAYTQSMALAQQYKNERHSRNTETVTEAPVQDTPISGDETMEGLPFSVEEVVTEEDAVPILGQMM